MLHRVTPAPFERDWGLYFRFSPFAQGVTPAVSLTTKIISWSRQVFQNSDVDEGGVGGGAGNVHVTEWFLEEELEDELQRIEATWEAEKRIPSTLSNPMILRGKGRPKQKRYRSATENSKGKPKKTHTR